MLLAVVYLGVVGTVQDRDDLLDVWVGEPVQGVIEKSDPQVESEELLKWFELYDRRGHAYRMIVDEAGPHHVQLQSNFFDAYLVLRDENGALVAEDDDGFFAFHSQLDLQSLQPDRTYVLQVCAIMGFGPYELRLENGPAPTLSPVQQRAVARKDAEEGLEEVQEALPGESFALCQALYSYACVLWEDRRYDQVRPLLQRVLELAEKFAGPEHPDTASAIYDLGRLAHDEQKYEEAQRLHERALRMREKVLGPKHIYISRSLERLGRIASDRSDPEKAIALQQRAISINDEIEGPDNLWTANGLHSLAWAVHELRDHEESKRLFQRALGIREKMLGPDHPDTARSLEAIARVANDLGQYEEARLLYERALAIHDQPASRDPRRSADVLHGLVGVLTHEGKYEEALRLSERSIAIREREFGPEDPKTLSSLRGMADIFRRQGRYAEARQSLERLVAVAERTLGPEHRDTASSLRALGDLLVIQGNYDEGKPLLERALAISERTLGLEDPGTGECYSSLGSALRRLGKFPEAKELLERNLAIQEKAWGPDHRRTAVSLNNLALVLDRLEEYDQATPLLERAFSIIREKLGEDHSDTATCLYNLAVNLYLLERYEEAQPYLEQALKAHELVMGSDHPVTTGIRSHLGLVHYGLGETDEAWLHSQQCLTSAESFLDQLLPALSEAERFLAVAQYSVYLQMLFSVALERPSPERQTAAYEALLRWKGRIFRTTLMSRRVEADLPAEQKRLLARLKSVQSELSRMFYAREIQDFPARDHDIRELVTERGGLERQLSLHSPGNDVGPLPGVRELGAALPEGSALLDFFVYGHRRPARRVGEEIQEPSEYEGERLTAWVMRSGGEEPARIDLGPAQDVEGAVRAFLQELVSRRGVRPRETGEKDSDSAVAAKLRQVLWEPLAGHLRGADPIFVAPDRFLGTLPLEVLQLEDGSYLLEKHSFVYLQDMVSLIRMPEERTEEEASLLLVGSLDYGSRDAPPESPPEPSTSILADRGTSFEAWYPLSWTRDEAEAVAHRHQLAFGEDARRLTLQSTAATEERLKLELPKFRSVHLATHGFFHPKGLPSMWEQAQAEGQIELEMRGPERFLTGYAPGLLSGLVCAGANLPDEEGRDDGLLTAEEVGWLDLSSVDLVVLSACETGLGEPRSGEGMLGLRRAFRQAGARTVVSSLWSVKDQSTADLMKAFYRNLWIEGQGNLEALRNAQLEILKKNRIQFDGNGRSSTWGAFVLSGDWR